MDAVKTLGDSLVDAKMGVVAHYYMDVELQGVLQAVKNTSDKLTALVGIADSLKMGDLAVEMCRDEGATSIACLGVDFMAESVQTIMSRNGYGHIPVYRATIDAIGCSLAESAERDDYRAWLETSKKDALALHVVYINTSLETKAVSASCCPTITCTSSNVLATMLQASVQVPNIKILYGPDTYMGNNLVTLFDAILNDKNEEDPWNDERIARDLHPQHTRKTLQRLRDSVDVYPSGNCVVHHMFGAEVVNTVKHDYEDAFVTAHLEVPGEMFQIAMDKSLRGMGVVGSTSDILTFISKKVQEAAQDASSRETTRRLKFILGTEAGMVTSIVKAVQDILQASGNEYVEAEVVFPVASDAVMAVDENDPSDLALVPGVSGGEGCSTAGGCATCPFMKMNDLDNLQDVVDMVLRTQEPSGSTIDEITLRGHLPPNRLVGRQIGNVSAVDLGSEPILYMREFMKTKAIPEELVRKINKVQ